MKTRIEKRAIDIIYPIDMKEAVPENLILCENFISKLIKSSADLIKIKINNQLKLVECNDKEIKSYLDLLLKSKKIDNFYRQFSALLHPSCAESAGTGILTCYEEGEEINYEMKETKPLPDFSWSIQKK